MLVPQVGDLYDQDWMEDANEPRKILVRVAEKVTCLSTLGMSQKDGKPKQTNTVILKPKVVLDSFIDDLRNAVIFGGNVLVLHLNSD